MISELAIQDLVAGALERRFTAGHKAVIIRCPEIVADLWQKLVENCKEQLPWELPLLDISRNYYGSGDITKSLGDVFYFQLKKHGYIARKIAIAPEKTDNKVVARPETFVQGNEVFRTDPEILQECQLLGQRIMESLNLSNPPKPYEISVQRLKYQDNIEDFENLNALVGNSLGRWGRLGNSLDRQSSCSTSLFGAKGFPDLYGMMAHIPILRSLAEKVNKLFLKFDKRSHHEIGHRTIEGDHVDYRYFTALCGRRDRMLTQIFSNGKWLDLPLDLSSLIVFPGSLSGFKPTIHRVVHVSSPGSTPSDPRTGNVTLMLGAA